MSMIRKLTAATVAIVLLVGAAFAAKPLEGKHLNCAMTVSFPPFAFEELDDKGNAKLVGYEIDVINYIANELGFTYTITPTTFKGLMGELQSGRSDFIISAMSPIKSRAENADFSIPYYYSQTAIIQYPGTNIKHLADVKGRHISATFGTSYCDIMEASGAIVHAMEDVIYAMQELIAKRVDGCVQDVASASLRVKQRPELTYYILPQKELDEIQSSSVNSIFCGLFPKGSELRPLFNQAIAKMRSNGDLAKIYEKWVGLPMPPIPEVDIEY